MVKKKIIEEKASIFKRINDQIKKNDDIKMNLIKDDNYMKWLCAYTSIYSSFSNDEEGVDEKESKLIGNISTLYDIVNEYAKMNYLSPGIDGKLTYYYLSYCNNLFMLLEIDYGTSKSYSCVKMYVKNKKINAIRFEDIKNNRVMDDVNNKNEQVDEIKNQIYQLHQMGFSFDRIKEIIDSIIYDISISEKKLKSYQKKLK